MPLSTAAHLRSTSHHPPRQHRLSRPPDQSQGLTLIAIPIIPRRLRDPAHGPILHHVAVVVLAEQRLDPHAAHHVARGPVGAVNSVATASSVTSLVAASRRLGRFNSERDAASDSYVPIHDASDQVNARPPTRSAQVSSVGGLGCRFRGSSRTVSAWKNINRSHYKWLLEETSLVPVQSHLSGQSASPASAAAVYKTTPLAHSQRYR